VVDQGKGAADRIKKGSCKNPNFCAWGQTRILLVILVCKSLLDKSIIVQGLLLRLGAAAGSSFVTARAITRERITDIEHNRNGTPPDLQQLALELKLDLDILYCGTG
jgi:hypothetical protein